MRISDWSSDVCSSDLAQTGLALGHVEQLYAFADRWRDPRELSGGPRMLSVGYLALVRPARALQRRPAKAGGEPEHRAVPPEIGRASGRESVVTDGEYPEVEQRLKTNQSEKTLI